MAVANSKWVEIYRSKNSLSAQMMQLALRESGIDVRIDGEQLQSALGELPAWNISPRILVDPTQTERALEVIRKIESQRLADDEFSACIDRCLACGHSMGHDDVKCASCGWSFLNAETN